MRENRKYQHNKEISMNEQTSERVNKIRLNKLEKRFDKHSSTQMWFMIVAIIVAIILLIK